MTLQEALDWTDLIVPRHDPFPDDEALVTLAAEVRRLRLILNAAPSQTL